MRAFTPTSCAERTALFKAVADGVTEFTDIAVVGSRRGEVNEQITSPCGVCRQALFEFGGPELNVIMAKDAGGLSSSAAWTNCCPSALAPPMWRATVP
ncbi:MAG: cytidine deaminase family protein [Faecalibacterium sp.]